MFGLNITALDKFSFLFAIAITLYVYYRKNPYEKGSAEFEIIRLFRIGLALLAWSFGFGLIGLAFALTAFIRGVGLIIGSVIIPIISIFHTLSTLSR